MHSIHSFAFADLHTQLEQLSSLRDDVHQIMSTLGKRPFPEATQLADIFKDDSDLTVRDNTGYLANMAKTTLFTRPTQMGKTTLLSVAEMVYSKKSTTPLKAAAIDIPETQRNAAYVVKFDFLRVSITYNSNWRDELRANDASLLRYIKYTVLNFVTRNDELKKYFMTPESGALAGEYLTNLAEAVEGYAEASATGTFLVVLVDEFDRPLRDTLLRILDNEFQQVEIKNHCPNYRNFFSSCKAAGQSQQLNRVLVTGVLPILLDLISEFKPTILTFKDDMADAVGLRDEDVDRMLDRVNSTEPFADGEMEKVKEAIRDHANHLKFVVGPALYHTRMVNELMNEVVMDKESRRAWLKNPSELPPAVTRESVPSSIYGLLKNNQECRQVAKSLVADREIRGVLNTRLNLPDVCTVRIKKDDYLTLLVHLGVASVTMRDGGFFFLPTSRYFRSEFFIRMVEVTLAPLFGLDSVKEIYKNKKLLQEFMATLPASGMARLISWASSAPDNRILELQFQGVLLGELHDSLLFDDSAVQTTQEDLISPTQRTDIQIKGNNTTLILELKQRSASNTPPTPAQINPYHVQLRRCIETVTKQDPTRLVAGFVVVMYAHGTEFHIEPAEPAVLSSSQF